jgi:hypothetical protein
MTYHILLIKLLKIFNLYFKKIMIKLRKIFNLYIQKLIIIKVKIEYIIFLYIIIN